MPKNTTITAKIYLEILQDRLQTHIGIHNATHFQHDSKNCQGMAGMQQYSDACAMAWIQPRSQYYQKLLYFIEK